MEIVALSRIAKNAAKTTYKAQSAAAQVTFRISKSFAEKVATFQYVRFSVFRINRSEKGASALYS